MLERVKNYAVLWVVPEPHFCNSLCKSLFSQSNLTSRRKVKSKWTPWSNGNFHMRSTMNIVACTDLKCQKDTGWDIVMLSCVFYIYIYYFYQHFFFSSWLYIPYWRENKRIFKIHWLSTLLKFLFQNSIKHIH